MLSFFLYDAGQSYHRREMNYASKFGGHRQPEIRYFDKGSLSHACRFEVDGRSLDVCLLSYTEVGLSNDVLPILLIHPFDCLDCLISRDIVSPVISRDIHSLVISRDIDFLMAPRDIDFPINSRDIVFPINSRDIVFPNWHDRKLFEFGIWIWSMSSSL